MPTLTLACFIKFTVAIAIRATAASATGMADTGTFTGGGIVTVAVIAAVITARTIIVPTDATTTALTSDRDSMVTGGIAITASTVGDIVVV